MGTGEHKKTAPRRVTLGILTISTTRTLETDKSGQWIRKQAGKEGHQVLYHAVVPDDAANISKVLLDVIREKGPQAMLLTGYRDRSDIRKRVFLSFHAIEQQM